MTRLGGGGADAGGSSPRSTSGSRSTLPGQAIVPDSGLTATASKAARSSRIGASGPPACSSPDRSTSCTAPSAKVSRTHRSASGSTLVIVVRVAVMAAERSAPAARGPAVAPNWRPARRDGSTSILATRRSFRQRSAQDLGGLDLDDRFVAGVDGVEVRWRVVKEVHPNHFA